MVWRITRAGNEIKKSKLLFCTTEVHKPFVTL